MSKKILGNSPAVKALLNLIQRVSTTKTNVLIIGESGTGKELVARLIHESGTMKDEPFIPVNCGAIPENLIESEMFGHKKGSFTGAHQDKPGLFQAADGGTLFLDEVGELPIGMQVKLLRAIQERVIRKVGGTDDVKVDVRIIAATNRDLEGEVARGKFREDLYYRLNVLLIKTPALRERKGDIKLLAEAFLAQIAVKYNKSIQRFDPMAMEILENHSWPGNIRELQNVIERAVTLETAEVITPESLPISVSSNKPVFVNDAKSAANGNSVLGEIRLPAPDFSKGPIDLEKILGEVEKTYLMSALESAGGVKKHASELLGITFRSIRYRLKKLGVESGDGDEAEG